MATIDDMKVNVSVSSDIPENGKAINKLVAVWNKIPAPVQKWIKGAETAVVAAVVASFVALPVADFTTKKGISEFAAGVAATAYGALRLYMTQSPVQNVVKQVVVSKELKVGEVSQTDVVSTTTTGAGPAITGATMLKSEPVSQGETK